MQMNTEYKNAKCMTLLYICFEIWSGRINISLYVLPNLIDIESEIAGNSRIFMLLWNASFMTLLMLEEKSIQGIMCVLKNRYG